MALRKLLPLMDRVLVEKIAPPAKSMGGVLLPDSAVQKVSIARLLPCLADQHCMWKDCRLISMQTWVGSPSPAAACPQINSATVVAVGPGRRTNTGKLVDNKCARDQSC
jgi:co-chaperonin GroES (HSP10)